MINLKKAVDLFIFDRETYCSEATINNYKTTLSYMINNFEQQFGCSQEQIDIALISPDHIRKYFLQLVHRSSASEKQNKIATRTVKTYSVDVRTFFHFLYKNDYIEKDIMKNIIIKKPEEKVIHPLYMDEVALIDSIFNTNSKTGLRNACIFHCMLDAGMRSGEVIRLLLDDVDFQHNIINIVNSKGSKGRMIPMVPNLKKLLHKYITLYRPVSSCSNVFVLSGELPEAFTPEAMRDIFFRLKRRSKIARLKPHLCRHTFATAFILQGGDLETLRFYLGHTSYETTKNYLHLAAVYKSMAVTDVYKLHRSFFHKADE